MNRKKLEERVTSLRQRLAVAPQKEALLPELVDLMRAAKALGNDGKGRYPDICNEVEQALDDLYALYFPAKMELVICQ